MRITIKNPLFAGWFLFALFLLYGTLIPFDFAPPQVPMREILKNFFNLSKLLDKHPLSRMDLVSNALLYLPFGFFSAGLLMRTRVNAFAALILGTTASFILSFSLEIAQAFSPSRISSIGDVIVNTLSGAAGALSGAVYFLFLHAAAQEKWHRLLSEKPFWVGTLIMAAAILIGGFIPFDVSIQISDLKQALKSVIWVPFSFPAPSASDYFNLATDGILLTSFAALFHFSLRLYSLRVPSFLIPTLLATLFLAGAVEFGQLFIVSRTTDTTHLVLALIAAIVGSLAASWVEGRILRSPSSTETFSFYLRLLGAFALSAAAAYLLLAPLDFHFSWETARANFSWTHLVPLYAYWVRTDIFAVQDLAVTVGIFAVLGGFLYSCFREFPFARGVALVLCLLFSAGIELLQLFEPGRTPDVTDFLSAGIGAWVGCWGAGKLFPQT